jgi:hypothetical protein
VRCRRARWFLSARCDGTLSERQRARLDEHLEHCAACRREAFYFSEIGNLASRLESAPVRPDFNLRLRAAIERQEKAEAVASPWYRFHLAPAWRPAIAAVAVVFMFVLTYGGYRVVSGPSADQGLASNSTINQDWTNEEVASAPAEVNEFALPSGLTPVQSDSPDADRVRSQYLAASQGRSDFVIGTVGLDDPTTKKPEPQYVLPVIPSEQMVRKVSY